MEQVDYIEATIEMVVLVVLDIVDDAGQRGTVEEVDEALQFGNSGALPSFEGLQDGVHHPVCELLRLVQLVEQVVHALVRLDRGQQFEGGRGGMQCLHAAAVLAVNIVFEGAGDAEELLVGAATVMVEADGVQPLRGVLRADSQFHG
jgi:hypothetical protein